MYRAKDWRAVRKHPPTTLHRRCLPTTPTTRRSFVSHLVSERRIEGLVRLAVQSGAAHLTNALALVQMFHRQHPQWPSAAEARRATEEREQNDDGEGGGGGGGGVDRFLELRLFVSSSEVLSDSLLVYILDQ